MIRPLWYSLLLFGAFAVCHRVDAQQPSTDPQPTRWMHPATTIETSAPIPSPQREIEASQPASFPSLRSATSNSSTDTSNTESNGEFAEPAITVTSSLAVVLGLFAALVWASRKFGNRAINNGAIPKEVLQSLGTTAIDAKTRVTMLRCGNRILIVAQTATGIHPLSEVTDPEEVRHLTATCLGSASRDFESTLQSIQREPVDPGFVDQPPANPRKRSKLFATA